MTRRRRTYLRATAILLCLTGAAVAAPAQAATYDLAGLWLFNESSGQVARDASFSGNPGTLGSTAGVDANDPTRFSLGWLGLRGALRFGGDDFVRVQNAPSLEPDGVTVVARVRATAPGSFRYVVSKGALSCETASYGLYTDGDGALRFYASDGVAYTLSPATASVWDGGWHIVRGAYNGTEVSLWVDGVKVGSTPANFVIGYNMPQTRDLYIGTYAGPCPSSMGFVGDVDGVALIGRYSTSGLDGLVG
jgi:hypothetical protein